MKFKLLLFIGLFNCINAAQMADKEQLVDLPSLFADLAKKADKVGAHVQASAASCRNIESNIQQMRQDMFKETLGCFDDIRFLKQCFKNGLKNKNKKILDYKLFKSLTASLKQMNNEFQAIATSLIREFGLARNDESEYKHKINYLNEVLGLVPKQNKELIEFCKELYNVGVCLNFASINALFMVLNENNNYSLAMFMDLLNTIEHILDRYTNIFACILDVL